MRCQCCDKVLTDYESSIKGGLTNTYLNTCVSCLKSIDIPYVGNQYLESNEEDLDNAELERDI